MGVNILVSVVGLVGPLVDALSSPVVLVSSFLFQVEEFKLEKAAFFSV